MNRYYLDDESTDVTECLDMTVRALNAANEMYFAIKYPMFAPTTFAYDIGKKYARVHYTNHGYAAQCEGCKAKSVGSYVQCDHETPIVPGQTAVAFFVDMTTGDVWKAAGWRGPALNFVRGNIMTVAGRRALSFGKVRESGDGLYFYPAF